MAEIFLNWAHLQRANLLEAHLERAEFNEAHLEGANLSFAHLEHVNLRGAHLECSDLRGAVLDTKTVINNATLSPLTRLGDIQWGGVGGVNLTQIDWSRVPTLGDEQGISRTSPFEDHEAAVRAYRQVAAQLRAQGLAEVADRYAERAQIRRRKQTFRQLVQDWRRPWRMPGDFLRWLFSWFLALLAGYGFHPGRSVFWYLATIFGFAFAYYSVGHSSGLIPGQLDAVVFSLTSFHGRGFFPGENVSLHHPLTVLAALEAVVGLLIEISFIATFTQRFFGAK
jgi:hypothetical protein